MVYFFAGDSFKYFFYTLGKSAMIALPYFSRVTL